MPLASALAAILLIQTAPTIKLDPILTELVEITNAYRLENKLAPLKLNEKLVIAAQLHSGDQAARNLLSHTGADGSNMQKRADLQKYNWRRLAENVAQGPKTAKEALKSWLSSAVHQKVIVGNYGDIGVGLATAGDGSRYWTLLLGRQN